MKLTDTGWGRIHDGVRNRMGRDKGRGVIQDWARYKMVLDGA